MLKASTAAMAIPSFGLFSKLIIPVPTQRHGTTYAAKPLVRLRILISLLISAASGIFCWYIMRHLRLGLADFGWAVRGAQAMLDHKNPYDSPGQLYPLPALFFGFPFVYLRQEIASGIFFGISSGLMAFALTRDGFHRLLVFLAYPYWAALLAVQWSPLIFASALLPWLLAATMAKPQIGIPVFLTHNSRRGLWACIAVGLLSLIVMPGWPLAWFRHFGEYERFIPLLVLPGPLLALAALRYRDRDARLLFLMAVMPQRWFYDMLILWLIPKSRREILFTVLFSWAPGILRWYHMPHSYTEVGRWSVVFIYLPMLGVIMFRSWRERREQSRTLLRSV